MESRLPKILFVTPDLRYGGTNSSLSNLFDSLKERYEIDVYSLYDKRIGDYSFSDRILHTDQFLYSYFGYITDLSGWILIKVALRKILFRFLEVFGLNIKKRLFLHSINKLNINQYAVVIAFQEGAATEFVSMIGDIKKIAWIHCDYARYHLLIKRDEELIYNGFDRIVCVSEYTSQSFKNIYPSLSDKVISIYNIYDKERAIQLAKDTIDDFRFDTSTFTILSVGRIDKVKRFSTIPWIARKLYENNKKFKWYVIGNVVEEDEYRLLVKNIMENGMEDYVILLGGKANPYPYFAKSDLFVSTSSSEACPIVFLEAQTFNLPIVTTDFGSSYEFIVHGKNGYISSIERMERSIMDVMDGYLQYAPQEIINNNIIVKQLKQVINGLIL